MSTFILGFRHGIDWDHIAAILDLTGCGSVEYSNTLAISQFHRRSVRLATWYALGHAMIVVALALFVRGLTALLPVWFERTMEQIVGVTLVGFGVWILLAIFGSVVFNKPFEPTSRAALIARVCDRIVGAFRSQTDGQPTQSFANRRFPAFFIGTIHGLGAETSTQLMLIASVASASNSFTAGALLISFAVGLVCSNSLIALAASAGFLSVSSVRPLFLGLGVVASSFSLYVGGSLLCNPQALPSMSETLKTVGYFCNRFIASI